MDAFGSLYVRHIAVATVVARSNIDDPGDAEDIVADAVQPLSTRTGLPRTHARTSSNASP